MAQQQALKETLISPLFENKRILDSDHFEIWQSVEGYLQPWLSERKTLISAWHQSLKNTLDQHFVETHSLETHVQHFCQVLMDYISAGHFEIYEKLLEESRLFNDGFISIAEPLYELIGHSTEHSLRFNERYSNTKSCKLRQKQLPHELAKLGESLEERFEAEDQLVKFLHQLHQQQ